MPREVSLGTLSLSSGLLLATDVTNLDRNYRSARNEAGANGWAVEIHGPDATILSLRVGVNRAQIRTFSPVMIRITAENYDQALHMQGLVQQYIAGLGASGLANQAQLVNLSSTTVQCGDVARDAGAGVRDGFVSLATAGLNGVATVIGVADDDGRIREIRIRVS